MIHVSDILEDQVVFYDLETDSQHAPYAKIKKIGVQYGFQGDRVEITNPVAKARFQRALVDPSIIKVGFNTMNYDNIVLANHGYELEDENLHDVFLMLKAIAPISPSYGLKFLNWWYFDDFHEPERLMYAWAKKARMSPWDAPNSFMSPYLRHDLHQTVQMFSMAWEVVQRPEHWDAYMLDRACGAPLLEMELDGGLFLDRRKIKQKIAILQKDKFKIENDAFIFSDGAVENPNSSKQVGAYLDSEGFALELSANGDFAVRKSDLVELREHSPIAECAYKVRKINANLKYFENYLAALDHDPLNGGWIPYAASISSARTRRFTSSSYYGINFQNPNEEAKTVQLVPPGFLGFWIDSTQVENVVHIFESGDDVRRRAYEADPDWSEYVWLCNRILGTNKTKQELDSIPSEQIPTWTVYKQYKTVKLALNFGMGVAKFCKTTGVSTAIGRSTFDTIHDACPAIRELQDDVARRVNKYGHVEDVFGHWYIDHPRRAYKLVAYLVQGCGTGSLPKAQIRANYETLHSFDTRSLRAGCLCTTTHDENSGRINLELGTNAILQMLDQLMYNMTERFSPLFDNIPLRAKLYLSKTNAADHIEVDINDKRKLRTIIEGEPCHQCGGKGTINKIDCEGCAGVGYVSGTQGLGRRDQPALPLRPKSTGQSDRAEYLRNNGITRITVASR